MGSLRRVRVFIEWLIDVMKPYLVPLASRRTLWYLRRANVPSRFTARPRPPRRVPAQGRSRAAPTPKSPNRPSRAQSSSAATHPPTEANHPERARGTSAAAPIRPRGAQGLELRRASVDAVTPEALGALLISANSALDLALISHTYQT